MHELSATFAAVGDPVRLRLLRYLLDNEHCVLSARRKPHPTVRTDSRREGDRHHIDQRGTAMKHSARRPWTLRLGLAVVACGLALGTASTIALVNAVSDMVS
ncbi:MAG: hypothetical protein KY440_10155 [Actinobacteria bacterium]|nr:hypothetical protein [Actinomycetota bacterium]